MIKASTIEEIIVKVLKVFEIFALDDFMNQLRVK
tara:strand:- start:105 stop:206 length:102 start_codon:yes stop_codon:yes gene_type:complete